MRAKFLTLLHDLGSRLSRATAFANTDNLGDALRLMQERHLDEVAQCHAEVVRRATLKKMNRPWPSLPRRDGAVVRGVARAAASGKFLAVN